MTIDAIKNEIAKRLREVRSDSLEFADSTHFPDLRRLTADALGEISTCTSAEDIEGINDLLAKIEDCWNLCKQETLGDESHDVLFEFDFELDDGDNEQSEDEEEEAAEPAKPRQDISQDIKNLEALYDKYEGSGGRFNDMRLKMLFKRSTAELEAAEDRVALSNARNKYHSRFNKLGKKIRHRNEMLAAKPSFDASHQPKTIKKPNILRIIFGCIALLTGVVYGIITAISESRPFYFWPGWVWGVAIAGMLYLLISLIYGIIAEKGNKFTLVRRMTLVRLILVPFAIAGAIALGISVPQIGLLGAFIATAPLTLGSIGLYLSYRLRLFLIIRKQRREKKKAK